MGSSVTVIFGKFEWDLEKEQTNVRQHQINFHTASLAFLDPNRMIMRDEIHSGNEERFFCVGRIGNQIATVRFTTRRERIRIIGAGFWRKGKSLYETKK